jgi:transposase
MILTAGQVHEATQARSLIEGLTLISLIADKGYDNDGFRTHLAESEVDVVIPPLGSRTAEKTARNFLSMLALAAAMIWLRDIA